MKIVEGRATVYISSYYEKIDEKIDDDTTTTIKKYYYAGGVGVAMNDNGQVRYFVTDHLGSTTKMINTDGTEYSDMEYLSWGSDNITPSDIGTSFKYTGQREAEAGLYFYNARWYDPELGRFIQADSLIPQPGNPLAWDRYAYGFNNPVNSIDPTGHSPESGCRKVEGCSLTEFKETEAEQTAILLDAFFTAQECSNGNSSSCPSINSAVNPSYFKYIDKMDLSLDVIGILAAILLPYVGGSLTNVVQVLIKACMIMGIEKGIIEVITGNPYTGKTDWYTYVSIGVNLLGIPAPIWYDSISIALNFGHAFQLDYENKNK
jgi:RHS repeat-associated protein